MVWKGLGGCVLPELWQDGEREATEQGVIDPGPVLLYQCFPRLSQEVVTCGRGGGVSWGGVGDGGPWWQQWQELEGWGVRVCGPGVAAPPVKPLVS